MNEKTITGAIAGDVSFDGKLIVSGLCQVSGDITCQSLQIDCGGNLDCRGYLNCGGNLDCGGNHLGCGGYLKCGGGMDCGGYLKCGG